jgi:hypothetical protein
VIDAISTAWATEIVVMAITTANTNFFIYISKVKKIILFVLLVEYTTYGRRSTKTL